jgi:hypothetical protein
MDTRILPASEADGLPRGPLHGPKGRRPLLTSHESPVTSCKLFSFRHFRKNASASPVASTLTRKLHLKPFRINTYKKGGGRGRGYPSYFLYLLYLLYLPYLPYLPPAAHLRRVIIPGRLGILTKESRA